MAKVSDLIERAAAMGVKQTYYSFIEYDWNDDKCACGLGAVAIAQVGSYEAAHRLWRDFAGRHPANSFAQERYLNFMKSIGVDIDSPTINQIILLNDTYFASFGSI